MSQRVFKVINNYIKKNTDYSFDDLKNFIDEQLTNYLEPILENYEEYTLDLEELTDKMKLLSNMLQCIMELDSDMYNSINNIVEIYKIQFKILNELIIQFDNNNFKLLVPFVENIKTDIEKHFLTNQAQNFGYFLN